MNEVIEAWNNAAVKGGGVEAVSAIILEAYDRRDQAIMEKCIQELKVLTGSYQAKLPRDLAEMLLQRLKDKAQARWEQEKAEDRCW